MSISIKGAGTALVTPFTADGAVDIKALGELVEYNISNGIDFLCILGTTAEAATLSTAEQAQVRMTLVSRIEGRVPVLLGFGGNDTGHMAARLKRESFAGVDALLIVTPYYNKPSQEGLYRHYRALSEASPLPIVLYNVPSRTGVNMQAETTLRLARDCRNIVGIKEASGNIEQISAILAGRPRGFRVLSGDDKLTLQLMRLGADGVISVVANEYPAAITDLVHSAKDRDYAAAEAIDSRLAPCYDLLFREGNPTGIKALLSLRGRCSNVLRLPLVPATDALLADLRQL